jgi:hypothetical protein
VKTTPRRRRHQPVAASFTASGNQTANAYVIHPAKTKWGPRRYFKELEFAMEAITARYPNSLPERVDVSILEKVVNRKLEGRYQVSRRTVARALKTLRAANR